MTSKKSVENFEKVIETIVINREKEIEGIPLTIVGNKIDLNEKREISTGEGKAIAEKYGALFFETSSLTNTNVQQVFFSTCRNFWSKYHNYFSWKLFEWNFENHSKFPKEIQKKIGTIILCLRKKNLKVPKPLINKILLLFIELEKNVDCLVL